MNNARLVLFVYGLVAMIFSTPFKSRFPLLPDSAESVATAGEYLSKHSKLPLIFEFNQGQMDAQIDFVSRGRGYTLSLRSTELDLAFISPKSTDRIAPQLSHSLPLPSPVAHDNRQKYTTLHMRLAGANAHAASTGEQKSSVKINYFLGNKPSRWLTDVATYARVKYHDVYPGIDIVYYGDEGKLESDFIVSPGADPSSIAMEFDSLSRLELDSEGDLRVYMPEGLLLQMPKPTIYQDIEGVRSTIASGYVVDRHKATFQIGPYNPASPLIIDPVLGFSSRLGGQGNTSGQAIAVDAAGNIYVTGDTLAVNFPIKKAIQRKAGGSTDVFVTKLTTDGKLLYSTYLGGSGADVGYGIAVDSQGNAYITGDTMSVDFPTVSPLQRSFGGIVDAFIAKLSPDGSTLLYSTYIGGSAGDRGQGIAVDHEGNAYVTGFTYSTNFPVTNPILAAFTDDNVHAFVLKLNSNGSKLIYATYLGGGNDRPDIGTGIATDLAGNAYVTGFTNSANFPSVNSLQRFVGPTDVFVTKLNSNGSAFIYSTHLGGKADDEGMAIAADAEGNAYVTGETESVDFPTTPKAYSRSCVPVSTRGAMREICSGGDIFVSKLSPDGSKLIYSTYVNGSGFEVGRSIAVDSSGNAYVTGLTTSVDFPLVKPLQEVFGGGQFDAFVFKLNANGSELIYSTYLGGSDDDAGYGIAVDHAGNAYVTGYTSSPDFIITSPPLRSARKAPRGSRDAFVTKIVVKEPSR